MGSAPHPQETTQAGGSDRKERLEEPCLTILYLLAVRRVRLPSGTCFLTCKMGYLFIYPWVVGKINELLFGKHPAQVSFSWYCPGEGSRCRQGGATWTQLGHVPLCTLCPLRRPLPTQGLQGPVSWPPSPSPGKEPSLAQSKVSFPGVVTHTVCVVVSLGPRTSGRSPTLPFTSGLDLW